MNEEHLHDVKHPAEHPIPIITFCLLLFAFAVDSLLLMLSLGFSASISCFNRQWAPCTLQKRDLIISAVPLRAKNTFHKHGIKTPDYVQHACEIDAKNNNNVWPNTMKK